MSSRYNDAYDAGYAEGSSQSAELKKQLAEMTVKRDVAVSTLEGCRSGRRVAQQALSSQCEETKGLREELITRDLVIEKMREELVAVTECIGAAYFEGLTDVLAELPPEQGQIRDLVERRLLWCGNYAKQALALQPSTDYLKARDRKRDAALLRNMVDNHLDCDLEKQAMLRESGEWEPELEIK